MDDSRHGGFGWILQVRAVVGTAAQQEQCIDHGSPLPANIYFPAIPTLARAFHQSTETINQTVTVYLVFQGSKLNVENDPVIPLT